MRPASASLMYRMRFALLLVFAAVMLAALLTNPHPPATALGLAVLAGLLPALALLRQAGLALGATLSALPGALWLGAAAYPLCLAFAVLLAAAWRDSVLMEKKRPGVGPVFAGLAGAMLLALAWYTRQPLAALAASALSAAVFVPVFARGFPMGDLAITRGNRQREAWARLMASGTRITEPRWGISLAASGVVLAVLAWTRITPSPPLLDVLAMPAAAAIVFLLTRDMRAALGGLGAAGLVLLFTQNVGAPLLLFVLLAGTLARAVFLRHRVLEPWRLGWSRALEEQGIALLCAGLAAILAMGVLEGLFAGLRMGCGLVAALLLFPAFTSALHAIWPPRRSVEELYKASAS